MVFITGVNHFNFMLTRSYIIQGYNSSTVNNSNIISFISNFNGYITIFTRNCNYNSTVTLINHFNVIRVSFRYFECCLIVVWQVFAITIISHFNSIIINLQVFYDQYASSTGNRNSVSSNTDYFNSHIASSISRYSNVNHSNITDSDVFNIDTYCGIDFSHIKACVTFTGCVVIITKVFSMNCVCFIS